MRKISSSLNVLGIAFCIFSLQAYADDAAKNYKKICIECHANTGLGKALVNPKTGKQMVNAMMGPRIAGLKEAYIGEQVKAIRAGVRKNANTISMKQKTAKLTDQEIADLAKYISKTLNPSAGDHKGMLEP